MSSAATRRKSAGRRRSRSGRNDSAHQTRQTRRGGRPIQHSVASEIEQNHRQIPSALRASSNRPGMLIRVAPTVGRVVLATSGAVLLCFVLGNSGLASGIGDQMSALGFDPQRARFLEFMLMALVGSFAAGVLLRWRLEAWLGGVLYYAIGYLIPYAIQAQNPVLAADGTQQMLIPGAFTVNVATLLAVAFIAAGAGAVLGQACGVLMLRPIHTFWIFLSSRLPHREASHRVGVRYLLVALPATGLALVLIAAFLLVATNIGGILTYGTAATLYRPVQVPLERGVIRPEQYRSPALRGSIRQFLIYLPPSYATSPTRRYPVIYMLHGVPGSMTNWFGGANADVTANDLFSVDKAREAILVSPDGNGPVYKASEWVNSLDGRQRMEDSVVEDLIPYVDTHFRTIADPSGRTVAGISDGGFAAANIALHHPDVFGTVLAMGGFFTADNSAVYGWGSLDDAIHRFNSPAMYITTPEGLTAARSLTFFIAVGREDGTYYRKGMAFYRQLQQIGAHVELIAVSGSHSWQTWGAMFAKALPLIEPPQNNNHPSRSQ